MHSPSRKPIIVLVAILDFRAKIPMELNCERLQAPWQALAFRGKSLDSTPSARIVEHGSDVEYPHLASLLFACEVIFHDFVVV